MSWFDKLTMSGKGHPEPVEGLTMLNLGGGELILLGIAVLLFIPPEKLPGAARSVGRFLSQLRTTFEEVKREITNPSDDKPDADKTGRK